MCGIYTFLGNTKEKSDTHYFALSSSFWIFFGGWEKLDFMNYRLTHNVSSMDNFGLDQDLQPGHFGRLDQPI